MVLFFFFFFFFIKAHRKLDILQPQRDKGINCSIESESLNSEKHTHIKQSKMQATTLCFVVLLFEAVLGYELRNSNQEHVDITPIEIVGNRFFERDTGNQFFIKGIAYQHTRAPHDHFDERTQTLDSMANVTTCLRDLENFVELGINVVRVYQIDPEANHDVCMNAYAKAKIYVLADLSSPELSIVRDNPTWDTDLYDRYASVVDAMSSYNNVLGFFGGNEVTNSKANTDASPFVKAAIRDMKDYIHKKQYRKIPVGYATNDDAEIRMPLSNYIVCTDRDNINSTSIDQGYKGADFLGVNMYEWCGYSSYTTSGYRERTMEYSNFPVPVFFSEYGCNNISPRPFTEVEALYGSTMSKVWSGGIAYEYFENLNHYGLVKEAENGEVTKLEDYEILKQRLNEAEPTPLHLSFVSKQNHKPEISCTNVGQHHEPKKDGDIWKASKDLPPTPDPGKCECLQSTLSCVVSPYKEIIDKQALLNQICSSTDCHDLESDGTIGYYGKFSDCGMKQKISFALNRFYLDHGRKEESCDFSGQAALITNNNNMDLNDIFARDGRTCQEAIGERLSFSEKKEQQYMKSRESVNSSLKFSNPSHPASSKSSRAMKSTGSRMEVFSCFLLLASIAAVFTT